jgi:hypothetical protein
MAKTATELGLVDIWAQMLVCDSHLIGLNSHFFALGGHSLLAIRLANEVKQRFDLQQYTFGVKAVFAYPTLAAMADAIEQLLTSLRLDNTAQALQNHDDIEQGEI